MISHVESPVSQLLVEFGLAKNDDDANFILELGKVRVNGQAHTNGGSILQVGDVLGVIDGAWEVCIQAKK